MIRLLDINLTIPLNELVLTLVLNDKKCVELPKDEAITLALTNQDNCKKYFEFVEKKIVCIEKFKEEELIESLKKGFLLPIDKVFSNIELNFLHFYYRDKIKHLTEKNLKEFFEKEPDVKKILLENVEFFIWRYFENVKNT
ncbi:MAG: hypothetical protein QXW35_05135 [Candidatus Aenigmatarchaeota archaeon]